MAGARLPVPPASMFSPRQSIRLNVIAAISRPQACTLPSKRVARLLAAEILRKIVVVPVASSPSTTIQLDMLLAAVARPPRPEDQRLSRLQAITTTSVATPNQLLVAHCLARPPLPRQMGIQFRLAELLAKAIPTSAWSTVTSASVAIP